MESQFLFEEFEDDSHLSAFESWLTDRKNAGALRQASSVAIYRDMWTSFAGWCLSQKPAVTLTSLDVGDLQAFQLARYGVKTADLSLTPRHALRQLRLIDKILLHHSETTGTRRNTAAADCIAAQPDVRYAGSAHADPLPQFLSVTEAKQLITFLSVSRPRPVTVGKRREGYRPLTWQQLRNRVAVALQLGAGLTPGDVRALPLRAPTSRAGQTRERPWKVFVPRNGSLPARETPVAPWAGELLQHWLQVRSELGIAGDFLFPSTRGGKPWSKKSQYESAKQVFEEAQLDEAEGGSFRLRHTFALRQLRRKADTEQVARWLGIEPEAMGKYRRVVTGVEDVI